jgi:hypothetical protein
MKLTLTITCDNAAFEDDGEVSRILRRAADFLQVTQEGFSLVDINGNTVGKVVIERDTEPELP